jgi:hypothetical protein
MLALSLITSTTSLILAVAGERYGEIVSGWPVTERRLRFRYPLDLSARFRSRFEMSLFDGTGRVVNVSSGGALVASECIVSRDEIGVGAQVEMSIAWPSLLDGRIPLQLFAVGRVLRRGASDFAVAFERHQFRTLIKSSRLGSIELEMCGS